MFGMVFDVPSMSNGHYIFFHVSREMGLGKQFGVGTDGVGTDEIDNSDKSDESDRSAPST